jgi:hypothetical protein
LKKISIAPLRIVTSVLKNWSSYVNDNLIRVLSTGS